MAGLAVESGPEVPEVSSARLWTCIVAVAFMSPSALAVPSLQASSLQLTGVAQIEGDAGAAFARASGDAFSWEVTAPRGALERLVADFVAADHPLRPDSYLYQKEPEWASETTPLADIILASSDVQEGGALLVTGVGVELDATGEGLTLVGSVTDPEIAQLPKDAQTRGADDGSIQARLDGTFLKTTLSDGVVTIRGDLSLVLYGPSYALTSGGETTPERTGQYETGRAALVAQGRMERHALTLEDAVMSLRAPGGVDLYTAIARIQFQGALRAEDATGSLVIDGAPLAPIDGALAYDGALALTLAPTGSGVLATAPDALATSGAIVAQGPPLALVTGALVVLALASAGGLVAWRHRARGEDLDEALLAMEERRWDDALPRLTRVAKRRPGDAGVLIDRALCLEQVGRFEEAAKAFEGALRAAPKHAEAHFYYARTLAKMRQPEAARVHLETALEHDPRLVDLAHGERVLRGL